MLTRTFESILLNSSVGPDATVLANAPPHNGVVTATNTSPVCIRPIGNLLSIVLGELAEQRYAMGLGDYDSWGPEVQEACNADRKLKHPGSIYFVNPRAQHPGFINALVMFAFSPRTVDQVMGRVAPLLACSCDREDEFIDRMQKDFEDTEDLEDLNALGEYIDKRYVHDLCGCLFHGLERLIFTDIHLAKIDTRGAAKPKDRVYIAFMHHVIKDPRLCSSRRLLGITKLERSAFLEFLSGDGPSTRQMVYRIHYSSIPHYRQIMEKALDRLLVSIKAGNTAGECDPMVADCELDCTSLLMIVGQLVADIFDDKPPLSVPSDILHSIYKTLCKILLTCVGTRQLVPSIDGGEELIKYAGEYMMMMPTFSLYDVLAARGVANL